MASAHGSGARDGRFDQVGRIASRAVGAVKASAAGWRAEVADSRHDPRPIARSRSPLVAAPSLLVVLAAPARGRAARCHDPREVHLADVRQLTFGGENAEAYWSFDGEPAHLPVDAGRPTPATRSSRMPVRRARTTPHAGLDRQGARRPAPTSCPATSRSSTPRPTSPRDACPPPPDRSPGLRLGARPALRHLRRRRRRQRTCVRLTETTGLRRRGDGLRAGRLDRLHLDPRRRPRALPDGRRRQEREAAHEHARLRRRRVLLADCSKIVWRASRPPGTELEDYQQLLGAGPRAAAKLELWVAERRRLATRARSPYLDAASFAPFFHPDGKRILFSSNYGDPKGREFDIWAVNIDGTDLERITCTPRLRRLPDVLARRQAASPSRRTATRASPGETNVFLARWIDGRRRSTIGARPRIATPPTSPGSPTTRARAAASARPGSRRPAPTSRSASARSASRRPATTAATARSSRSTVTVALGRGDPARDRRQGGRRRRTSRRSASRRRAGQGRDRLRRLRHHRAGQERRRLRGLDVKGKIVVVRRFVPRRRGVQGTDEERRYGDLRHKAFTAREHGAVGLLVVDLGRRTRRRRSMASARRGAAADARARERRRRRPAGGGRAPRGRRARSSTGGQRADLRRRARAPRPRRHSTSSARLDPAQPDDRRPGVVVVGAHYDHLGRGGASSLAPGSTEIHNGADDNASGAAGAARGRAPARRPARRARTRDRLRRLLRRGAGLLGSTHFVRQPPPARRLDRAAAMLNMDMVGRLRGKTLTIVCGASSAEEWPALVDGRLRERASSTARRAATATARPTRRRSTPPACRCSSSSPAPTTTTTGRATTRRRSTPPAARRSRRCAARWRCARRRGAGR